MSLSREGKRYRSARTRATAMATAASLAALAVGLAAPARAVAAAPDTRGFSLAAMLQSTHINSEDERTDATPGSVFVGEQGVGVVVALGYGFTPEFATRIVLSGASHETSDPDIDVQFGAGTIEAAYLFRAGAPFRPYLFGGVGGYSLESQKDAFRFETTGPGVTLGGGLLYFVSEHVGLDAALHLDFINWEKRTAEIEGPTGSTVIVETPIEEEGGAARFAFGLGWWF
ncbi:MAG: outer membrane beta-barrel protein [bacterium]